MKLVTYLDADGQPHLGALQQHRIVNLHQASNAELPDDMLEFLRLGPGAMQTARDLIGVRTEGVALDTVKLLAPITNPSKVVAIGLNYMDHALEQKRERI